MSSKITELKISRVHLIESDDGSIMPMVQIFFENRQGLSYAIAMPLTVYNSPANPKGNA